MSTVQRIVAVVDDDIRVLESLENLLESAGHAVRKFSSPGALLAAGLDDLDCVITDIGMPDMDGFQLREAVARTHPGLPVFMMTGRHEIADQPGKAGRATALFRKPIDGQALLAAVEKSFVG